MTRLWLVLYGLICLGAGWTGHHLPIVSAVLALALVAVGSRIEYLLRGLERATWMRKFERSIWPVLNRERGVLIDRSLVGRLSREDEERLAVLNEFTDEYLDMRFGPEQSGARYRR